jgi:DNA ligase (NAD+)
MLKAVAIGYVNDANGNVIGYKLKDETGKEMEVNIEAIIGAIKTNKINILNLRVDENDKLVVIKKEERNTETTKTEPKKVDVKQIKSVASVKYQSSGDAKIDRIHELVNILNKARYAYEQEDEEIMSNYEYDKLYDELKALEEETGTVLNNSPTVNVGYEVVSDLPKKKHQTPMLSLEKTKERDELIAFLNGREGVLSWKLDGLTVVLTYDNGVLTEAVTRGNGEVGEVVTANAKTFENLPRKIAYNGHLVLRGEATISYADFEAINNSLPVGEEPYKNPRNLCSGSVRQLDSSITAERHVNWTCFNIESYDGNLVNEVDKQLEAMKMLGFDVVEYEVVNPSNLLEAIDRFEAKIINKEMGRPSDGLVLTYRDKAYGKSLGRTAKAPRHSKAFKWQDETAVTTVTGVEWSVGKSGVITPVIEFVPTDIEGSTVSRASSHNVSIFLDMEFGIGDEIEVYKANMIIPQVSENLTRSGTCEIPGICPCCGCPTEIHEDPKSGVYTLWCMNADCEAKGNRLFKHFVSRDAMNIDGISGSTLETLSEAGIITDLPSIFHLDQHQSEIINMSGFGQKSYINMVTAINNARNVKLANLIYSLAIPNIGLATAKLICKHFNYDLADTVAATYDDLINIEGIGDVIADSFVGYFNDEANLDQFIRLVKELNIIHEEISSDTSMSGVTICVTGDVYIFPNRRAIKDLVESKGGKLTGSVSRSTNYLITNDTTSGSRKNKAAQEYGIPILTEQEFIDKFNLDV